MPMPNASSKPKIIFDTSAINALDADPTCSALTAALQAGFYVRLAETNVEELAATTDARARHKLLDRAQTLLSAGECILPYQLEAVQRSCMVRVALSRVSLALSPQLGG